MNLVDDVMRAGRLLARGEASLIYERVSQRLHLGLVEWTDGWRRLQRQIHAESDDASAEAWLQRLRECSPIFASGAKGAFLDWAAAHPEWQRLNDFEAEAHFAGDVRLFDRLVKQPTGSAAWRRDPLSGGEWQSRGVGKLAYSGGEVCAAADPRNAWELSRFGWFPALALYELRLGDGRALDYFDRTLGHWLESCPVGRSMVWYPMEAAVRALSLAQSVALLATRESLPRAVMRRFLVALRLCVRYVDWTLEVSDRPNNHYLAGLVALGVGGRTLLGVEERAANWVRKAQRRVPRQFLEQFGECGLHYEGSSAYHRFVTELGVLWVMSEYREGRRYPAIEAALLRAGQASRAMRRPDGWAVNFGDNDSARVFNFDSRHTRDHAELLAALHWLSGCEHGPRFPSAILPLMGPSGGHSHCSEIEERAVIIDGLVALQSGGGQVVLDASDVGLNGRGGHGHNDSLSIELSLGGEAVVIDPGTYTYTGNPTRFRQMVATDAHNTLVVDGEEQAPILGRWRIRPNANATRLRTEARGPDGDVEVLAEHRGYARPDSPRTVTRQATLAADGMRAVISDEVHGAGVARTSRRFQFPCGSTIDVESQYANATLPSGRVIRLRWDQTEEGVLEDRVVADSFGFWKEAPSLVLRGQAALPVRLTITFEMT